MSRHLLTVERSQQLFQKAALSVVGELFSLLDSNLLSTNCNNWSAQAIHVTYSCWRISYHIPLLDCACRYSIYLSMRRYAYCLFAWMYMHLSSCMNLIPVWISNLGANAILPVGCWSTVFLVVFHFRNSNTTKMYAWFWEHADVGLDHERKVGSCSITISVGSLH